MVNDSCRAMSVPLFAIRFPSARIVGALIVPEDAILIALMFARNAATALTVRAVLTRTLVMGLRMTGRHLVGLT